MMKINILASDENVGTAIPFAFTAVADEIDAVHQSYTIEGPVEIKGSVMNTGRVYRVEGMLSCKKAFQCDRCLENFVQQQQHSFTEDYKRGTEEETDDADEEQDVSYFDGDVIDIADLIRDTILVAQPLNNICSPACRGLCMVCGVNLNQSECGCNREITDPRLAVLQQLLNKK
ncbi:MAG: YceD family protein [Selenomonadaceae bacterium]|jgi:uncharacterized protein